jgi:GNAT superfamily N-acetyltransferase
MAHGQVYAAEFGWDTSFEALVAEIVAGYARDHNPREQAWIAEVDGERAGCVFCVASEEVNTAKLRILLVDPRARGNGVGGKLVDRAIELACRSGYARMQLWTNHPLTAARRIYVSRGFRLVRQEPHRSFGAELIGQTYELTLSPSSSG